MTQNQDAETNQLVREVVECFDAAPALASFVRSRSKEELQLFARRWQQDEPLKEGESLEQRPPGLRLVVSGRMQVQRRGWVLPGNVQIIDRGGLFGREALVRRFRREAMLEWLAQPEVTRLLGPAREQHVRAELEKTANATSVSPLSNAIATEDTTLLVLPEQDLQSAPAELYDWALRGFQADLLGESIVGALGQDPRLSAISEWDLFRLLESASVVDHRAPPHLVPGVVPHDFYVLLSGRCRIEFPGGDISTEQAPVCLALKNFLLKQPLRCSAKLLGSVPRPQPTFLSKLVNLVLNRPAVPSTREEPWVAVQIDGGYFKQLLDQELGFRRAVYRGSPELLEPAAPVPAHQVLLLDGEAETLSQLPSWLLVDGLAERLAGHLHEHVRVLHVTQAHKGHPSYQTSNDSPNGWVLHQWQLLAPESSELPPLLPRPEELPPILGLDAEDRVNVTLVDALSLSAQERTRLWARIARELAPFTDEPIQLLYLSRTPQGFPDPSSMPGRVQLIPTGVLTGQRPASVSGALYELLAKSRDERKWTQSIQRALEAAQELLSAVGRYTVQSITLPEPKPSWPMRAVRMRFPEASELPRPGNITDLLKNDPRTRESFDRWARAATNRRVGVALGGGGAFGFVHVAVLRKLMGLDEKTGEPTQPAEGSPHQVPIDMVSGSSFGSMVGAFFCVGGATGLEIMAKNGRWFAPLVPTSVLTSVGIQLWLDAVLGPVTLDQLEVPLFPVVSDADIGTEWDVSQGTVGFGVRASGSLPPVFAPTIDGNRRLLDGGIVANVPVNVLRQAGADMLIASNPISEVSARPRQFPQIPVLSSLWRQLNPVLRVEDTLRALQLIVRMSGTSQVGSDDVLVYLPRRSSAWLNSFDASEQLAEAAEQSVELGLMLTEAHARWRALLNNPPSLLRISGSQQSATISLSQEVIFDGTEFAARSLRGVLGELRDYLREQETIIAFTIVVIASTARLADLQAESLRDYFLNELGDRKLNIQIDGRTWGPEERGWGGSRIILEKVQGIRDELPLERKETLVNALPRQSLLRQLELDSEKRGRAGNPDMARRLALEAALIERSPGTARVLRQALELRGSLQGQLEAESAATALAWSPAGPWLAVGYKDGSVRIWDATRRKVVAQGVARLGKTNPAVRSLAWSPKPGLLASIGAGHLELWEHSPQGVKLLKQYETGSWDLPGLAFSPDSRYLLGPWSTPGADGSVGSLAVFRAQDGTALRDPSRGDVLAGNFRAAAWAPVGAEPRFATVEENRIALWVMTDTGPRKLNDRRLEGARALAWRPDGKALAVGGRGACLLLSLSTSATGEVTVQQRRINLGRGDLQVHGVTWSQDASRVLAAVPEDGAIYVWDGARQLQRVLQGEGMAGLEEVRPNPRQPAQALTWSSQGVCVWNVASGQQLAMLGGYGQEVQQAEWNAAGTHVASIGAGDKVLLWSAVTEDPLRASWAELQQGQAPKLLASTPWPQGFTWPPQGFTVPLVQPGAASPRWGVLSPDKLRVAVPVMSPDGYWQLRALAPAEALRKAEAAWSNEPLSVRWSPDGAHVALLEPRRVSLWQWNGTQLVLLKDHRLHPKGSLRSLDWHPGGRWLAIGDSEQPVLLWKADGASGPEPVKGDSGQQGVRDLAWSPRGTWLAIAEQGQYTRVIKVAEAEAAPGGLPHSMQSRYPLERVAWSPDEHLLATSDEGGTLALWHVTTGASLLHGVQPARGPGTLLVWSADSSSLLSVDRHGDAVLWQPRTSRRWEPAAEFDGKAGPLRDALFSEDGRWLAVVENSGAVRFHPIDFETLVGCVKARQASGVRVVARSAYSTKETLR